MRFDALVARPVNRKERDSKPAALEAVAKEWARLRSIRHKGGVGVWDKKRVKERKLVVGDARQRGITVHPAAEKATWSQKMLHRLSSVA